MDWRATVWKMTKILGIFSLENRSWDTELIAVNLSHKWQGVTTVHWVFSSVWVLETLDETTGKEKPKGRILCTWESSAALWLANQRTAFQVILKNNWRYSWKKNRSKVRNLNSSAVNQYRLWGYSGKVLSYLLLTENTRNRTMCQMNLWPDLVFSVL